MGSSFLSANRKLSSMSARMSSKGEDEEDDYTVPDEKDWRGEIAQLKTRTGEFNIQNYVSVLNEHDKKLFEKIVNKVPVDKRVYI